MSSNETSWAEVDGRDCQTMAQRIICKELLLSLILYGMVLSKKKKILYSN